MNHLASFGILLRRDSKQNVTNSDAYVDEGLPPAHRAAAKGDTDQLVQIIQEDPSLLEQHSLDGLTPLGQAVMCQQLDAVKRLIKLGANLDSQDSVGRTCLSIAAYQGWHEGVMCLLRNGARQSLCDKSGRYPLHAATYHSDVSTMALLLNGLSKKEINQADNELMTAVHWAAFHDRPEHLMQLIQKGGDILAKDIDGKLPLHWAAQNGSFQCTHRLTSLKEGLATVNDVDYSGKTPAHYAAAAGASNIIKILARCEGIDFEIEDPDERTPLHWAAAMGHARTVDTLLRLGVNAFPSDVDGCTPLDYSLQIENPDCMKVMEVHLGARVVKKHKQRLLQASKTEGTDMKYRYNREVSSTSSLTQSDIEEEDIPSIIVQAPTTTLSKATTNPTILGRMYTASSNTDTYTNPPESPPSEFYNPPNQMRQQKQTSIGGALANLVGASFMTGAQGPILTNPSYDVANEDTTTKFNEVSRTRETSPPTDNLDGPTSGNSAIWATRQPETVAHSATRDKSEIKIMTSGNTPEFNRVSVQSFRSIPPIISSAKQKETSRTEPENVLDIQFKGTKLVPLPSIPTKEKSPELSPRSKTTNVSERLNLMAMTPKTEGISAPAQQMPLRVTAQDFTPPVTHRNEHPPLDFMTENIAETRVLTKKFKNSLHKFYGLAEAAKNHSHSSSKETEPKGGAGKTTSSKTSQRDEASALSFMKHSRIPSTRVGTQIKQPAEPTGNKNPAVVTSLHPGMGRAMASNLSSVSMIQNNDKYLHVYDDSTPQSPTPLTQATKSRLPGKKPELQTKEPSTLKRSKYNPNILKTNQTTKDSQNSKAVEHVKPLPGPGLQFKSSNIESSSVAIQSLLRRDNSKPLVRQKHEKKVQLANQISYY